MNRPSSPDSRRKPARDSAPHPWHAASGPHPKHSDPVANGHVDLRPLQLFFLAAAVFVVSAGYGALLPLLPAWLAQQLPGADSATVSRHVGYLSAVYTAGVLVGAPIWGLIADRLGRPRILMIGLIGYVASLLLLLPAVGGLWAIYALRATAGGFVAAIVPIVPALVAAHTPKGLRARRFAWLGAASLLGFLLGPGLNAMGNALASLMTTGAALVPLSTRIVIVLSAVLGASMMLGLRMTLPMQEAIADEKNADADAPDRVNIKALWWLSIALMFALSGFELGIVLQGRQHAGVTTQDVALIFAECSLVMLGINALLFFTSMLDRAPPRLVIAVGSLVAVAGLLLLSLHQTPGWMSIGISLTSAGTGLVLPVIAFLAAGAERGKLGATMGGLAAAAGLGQTLGSIAGGWLFGALAQRGFGWLTLPLLAMLALMLFRPGWWKAPPETPMAAAK
jgi:MFS family permease